MAMSSRYRSSIFFTTELCFYTCLSLDPKVLVLAQSPQAFMKKKKLQDKMKSYFTYKAVQRYEETLLIQCNDTQR